MKYLLLVASEGLAAPQEVAVMQREIPGWAAVRPCCRPAGTWH